MKRFSPSVPAIRSRIAIAPALLVLLAPAVFMRCIPNPDISGLPPYDGGSYPQDSSFTNVSADSSFDAAIFGDAGSEASASDAGPQFGAVTGFVVDYTQGSGAGVVPGATITVTTSGTTTAIATQTADANGLFSVSSLPAGVPLQLNVTKPTDVTNGVAYSSTAILVTIPAGQTVSVAPVLHEGCFQTVNLVDGASEAGVTLQTATCPGGLFGVAGPGQRPGSYAAMTFESDSFTDSSGAIWAKQIRIEMIPLAYPLAAPGAAPDLSWIVGLPGSASGGQMLGAAEYRVVKVDPGQSDDGELLQVATNAPVSIAVPLSQAPSGQTFASSYNVANQMWYGEPSAVLGAPQSYAYGSPAFETDLSIPYVMVRVPHLTWWGVGAQNGGNGFTTCVTGSLQAGAPLANVLVRAVGTNYFGMRTTISDSTGTFCMDFVADTPDASGPQGVVYAEALSGGAPYAATQSFNVVSFPNNDCATGVCTSVGTMTLSPTVSCVAGSLTYDQDGGPSTLDTYAVDLNDYGSDQGIQQQAYVGQVNVGDAGTFCALAPPGGNMELVQPGNAGCSAPHDVGSYQVLTGTSTPTCGGSGCQDAGALLFSCSGG